MAVLALFTGLITKPQYEILQKEVAWTTDQPNGAVLHASSFDQAGRLHVADVWETAEALNTFVAQRLLPVMRQHQIPEPSVSVYPAHTVQAYRAIEKYRI